MSNPRWGIECKNGADFSPSLADWPSIDLDLT